MAGTPGQLWPFMLPTGQQGLSQLCAVSASGVRVRFADGIERLDGTSGLWNCNLGFGNPAIAQAVAAAMRDASYLNVWGFENHYARRAAAELIEFTGGGHYERVLFSTSGGAANDMAMKLARHYHALRGDDQRKVILGLRGGYHGLTYGAFALTDAQLGQRMYGVDRRLVAHVNPNELDEIASVLDRLAGRVAAVVVEPVLGTGAVPLTGDYIAGLLRLRREHGFLLVADEISTGFYRVGPQAFATAGWPAQPDVLISAKGLTNGTLAASALVVSSDISKAFLAPDVMFGHAETQAGTAVSCAAILATISEMRRLDAGARSAELSARLDAGLARLMGEQAMIAATTGAGCLRALRLSGPAGEPLAQTEVPAVIAAIRDAGALVHPGPSCVQLLPALIYSAADLEELLDRIGAGLTVYARARC